MTEFAFPILFLLVGFMVMSVVLGIDHYRTTGNKRESMQYVFIWSWDCYKFWRHTHIEFIEDIPKPPTYLSLFIAFFWGCMIGLAVAII